MEASSLSVKERLSSDFKRLNKYFVWPQVLLLLSLFFLFDAEGSFAHFSIITLGALILRLFFYHVLTLLFIGIGWWGIFMELFSRSTFHDSSSIFLLSIIFILMGLSASTLSSSFRTGVLFLTSILVYPLYFLTFSIKSYDLSLLLIGSYFFQIWRIYDRNKELKKSFKDQVLTHTSNLFLSDILDVIPGLCLIIDEEGVYRFVNNYKDGLFKREVLGKALGCFEPEGEFLKALIKFREGPLAQDIVEISTSFFGNEEFFMAHFRKIETPLKGVVAITLPMTELVLAKNDLKVHEARSQFSSKLASLGEFSANMAHEINNPLTIIEGAVNLSKMLLKEEPLDKHALEKNADKVMMTTQRIARIIKSLRMLSGNIKEEPFTNVHFMDIAEPTVEITKSKLLENKIELRVLPMPEDIPIFGNEVQLSQVIMNLVSNSIDAIKDSSGEKWIEIEFKPSIVWLDIFVRDSGNGVSEDIAEKIMEPFFTTKSSTKGTGLGLSICKNILVSHGASLDLIKEARTTTFRIRFPRMSNRI